GTWRSRRVKAVRFGMITIAGRVIRRARQMCIRCAAPLPVFHLFLRARETILAPACASPPVWA
ncbi:hypothetical protein JW905_00455, partial [bacterium]|nr:hypothetical protein [candidate division CSSED10-310 bacterium]